MLNKICKILIILTLSAYPVSSYSINANSKIEYLINLRLENGLSHDGTTSIIEDSRGYVWIGTYDGLNRYDGYSIKIYKNNPIESILSSNRIITLAEDKFGKIWIGTEEGITVYDYEKDKFIKLTENNGANKFLEHVVIKTIIPHTEKDEMICLTEDSGILVYGLDLKRKRCDVNGEVVSFKMHKFDKEHHILATKNGIMLYNINTGEYNNILKDKVKYAQSICVHSNKIYYGDKLGVRVIEYKITPFNYEFNLLDKVFCNKYNFRNLYIDNSNAFWLTTELDGVMYIDNVNLLDNLENMPFREKLIRVSSFTDGNKGRLWITTFDKGILLTTTEKNKYNCIKPITGNTSRGWNFTKIKDNKLLIRHHSNYTCYDFLKESLTTDYKYSSQFSGKSTIFNDNNNNLFAIAEEERYFSLYKYVDNSWQKIPLKEELPNDIVYSIKVDRDNNIWIINNDNLYRITKNKKDEYYYTQEIKLPKIVPKILKIRDIAFDPNNRAWIASSNHGLYMIDNISNDTISINRIKNYHYNPKDLNSLSSNFTTSIYVTDSTIYIGTEGGGLNIANLNSKNLKFRTYTERNGLSHNVIKNILPSNNGEDLWLATNNGLSHFIINDTIFQNYYANDGLPFNAFNYPVLKMNDSCFIMSGAYKLVSFNPHKITAEKQNIPNIVFDDLYILNNRITPNKEYESKVLIKHMLKDGDTLELKYKYNIFSIKALSLHYTKNMNYNIKYRIVGLNDSWITQSCNNSNIFFSGLKPGKYILEVSAANTIGEWGEPISLNIIITPPFWRTIWAYIVYIILFVTILGVILRTILNMQSLKHNLEIEAINKEDAAGKQRYFSNIAHEIKTPLSLVVTASDTLYDRYNFNADISEKLKLIQRQSRKISQMIDTIQSVQLNDLNMLLPKYSTFEFNKLIEAITSDFRYLANKQKKILKVDGCTTPIYVKADISMMEKVINNLLNNAHKYSSEGANITLKWSSSMNKIILEVSDSGMGISKDDLPYIFDRFYRGSNQNLNISLKGSGIGLSFSKQLIEKHNGTIVAESRLNEGSKFTIELPIITSEPEDNLVLDYSLSEYVSNCNIIGNLNNILDNDKRVFNDSLVYIVEDNDELRTTLEEFISKYFNVKSFANGEECLNELENSWPNIILSDVMMPKVDGFELCSRVKSNINTNHIPVILLTACTSINEKIKCREAGADIYISKPFYPKYVLSCIEAILGNYRKLQEKYQGGSINETHIEETNIEETNIAVNNKNHNEFMNRLYELINNNLDNEDIDFNIFARELCINRTTFFMKVKAITGKTPYELIKDYRLIKSAELLSKGNTTIEEVYSSVGFKSRTHFSKLFKDKYGVPPSKYVKG